MRAKVEELHGRLAQVRALGLAGRFSQGLEQIDSLAESAEATGFRPLMAEVWLEQARLQSSATNTAAALVSAHRSARAFLGSGQMRGVAEAWILVVASLQQQGPQMAQELERWLQYLDEAIVAQGNPLVLRGEYERRLAFIRMVQGRPAEGLEHARKAVALQERLRGDGSALAYALVELLRAAAVVGNYEEAMAAGQRAVAMRKTTVGLEHPATLQVLSLIGALQGMTWHLADSTATYEQVLAIMRRMPETNYLELNAALNNLAVIYVEQGRHAEGELLLEQALAILDEHKARESFNGVISLQSLAESKYLRGDHAGALKLARESLALAEKAVSPRNLVLAVVLTTLGEAELEAGSASRARAVLERALPLLEELRAPPKEAGHARFALARTLEKLGVERPRMLTLLARARKDFDEAGAPAGRLRASWDEWVKARRLEASPQLQQPQ